MWQLPDVNLDDVHGGFQQVPMSVAAQVDLHDTAGGKKLGSLSSDFMTAIVSRGVAHPYLPALAAGSASGRLHIYFQ